MARSRRRVSLRFFLAGIATAVALSTLVAMVFLPSHDIVPLLLAEFFALLYLWPVVFLVSKLDIAALGPAMVEIHDGGVLLRSARGDRWIARADITNVRVLSWPMGATLEVSDKLGVKLEAEGLDRHAAHLSVDRLGFDARSHPQTWDLSASPWWSGLYGAFLGLFVMGFFAIIGVTFFAIAAIPVSALAGVLFRGRVSLRVGADGFRWSHRTRGGFVSFTDVVELSLIVRDKHFPVGIRVILRNGGVLELLSRRHHDDRALGAFEHLRHVFESWRVRQQQASETLLDRGGRTVTEWRDAMRALLETSPSYRGVALDAETLSQIAEDPAAPAEHRVGASLALGATPEARVRIRIAAERLVNVPLREAMVAAVEDRLDDDTAAAVSRGPR